MLLNEIFLDSYIKRFNLNYLYGVIKLFIYIKLIRIRILHVINPHFVLYRILTV